MKLAVIVSDANHLINVGGEIDRTVKMFELPAEIADYIAKFLNGNSGYVSVSLGLGDDYHG